MENHNKTSFALLLAASLMLVAIINAFGEDAKQKAESIQCHDKDGNIYYGIKCITGTDRCFPTPCSSNQL